jgi:hypothetical protein
METMNNPQSTPSETRVTEARHWRARFGQWEKVDRPLPDVILRRDNEEVEMSAKIIVSGTVAEYIFWKRYLGDEHYKCSQKEINFLWSLFDWIKNPSKNRLALGNMSKRGDESRLFRISSRMKEMSTLANDSTLVGDSEDEQDLEKGKSGQRGMKNQEQGASHKCQSTTPPQTSSTQIRNAQLGRWGAGENSFIVPPLRYVWEPKLHDAPKFSGEENVKQWIREVGVLLSLQIDWTPEMKLLAVVPLLEGDARINFINHQADAKESERITTWDQLAEFLREQYYYDFTWSKAWREFESLSCRCGEERKFVTKCRQLTPLFVEECGERYVINCIRDKVEDDFAWELLYKKKDISLSEVFKTLVRAAAIKEVSRDRNESTQQLPVRECFICRRTDHLKAQCPYRYQSR